LSIHVTRHPA